MGPSQVTCVYLVFPAPDVAYPLVIFLCSGAACLPVMVWLTCCFCCDVAAGSQQACAAA